MESLESDQKESGVLQHLHFGKVFFAGDQPFEIILFFYNPHSARRLTRWATKVSVIRRSDRGEEKRSVNAFIVIRFHFIPSMRGGRGALKQVYHSIPTAINAKSLS